MEVMVATVIAVIAVVGLAHSFGMGRALINRHENARDALALAQQRLEFLLGLPQDNPDLTPNVAHGGPIQLHDTINGTESWTVIWVDDPIDGLGSGDLSGVNDYKRVTVTISWIEASVPEQVQLSRILLVP
jgi:hypothetical protein